MILVNLANQKMILRTLLYDESIILWTDPVHGTKREAQAVELQAIGRAHRQGQTKQISIVRFIVRNSIDHKIYLRNNNIPTDSCIEYDPETYKPSISAPLTRAASLTKSGSFSALTVGDLKRSLEITNNTNEKEKKHATTKKNKSTTRSNRKNIKYNNNTSDDDEEQDGE